MMAVTLAAVTGVKLLSGTSTCLVGSQELTDRYGQCLLESAMRSCHQMNGSSRLSW